MPGKKITIISLFLFSISVFAFVNRAQTDPGKAGLVKQHYLQQSASFQLQTEKLLAAVKSGDEKRIRREFINTRNAYKKIELYAEYWFSFYATRFNGPPIDYFEESESDMPVQHPSGLQLVESYLYPQFDKKKKAALLFQASELKRYAAELPKVNESFVFSTDNIFDALIEELYRLTALTIAGFDSQLALNSLPECSSALTSINEVLEIFKDDINASEGISYQQMNGHILAAIQYLLQHPDFNSFNRLAFIKNYLDPLTKMVGSFIETKHLKANPAGQFYAAIKKNGSLFRNNAFDPYRFLDDYSTSATRIELGRKLFYEPALSANGQRSCASCHIPGKAFTDGLKTSLALDGHSPLPRNAPTIWNAALQRNLFYDSRTRNLEDQVMAVLNNAKEMHGSAQQTAANIISKEAYKTLYEQAYPGASADNTATNICNAIASYERTLIAVNARFDQFMNGKNTLSKDEINGFNLFMGKAKCGTCHFMPLFGGAKPPRYYYTESEVLGIPLNNFNPARPDRDSGRYLVTGSPVHLFSFKTPSLRNVALTAPYMHNGVFGTLDEVIDFYNNGGGKGLGIAPANQSLSFDKLNLTGKEKKDVIAFLKSLTDTSGVY